MLRDKPSSRENPREKLKKKIQYKIIKIVETMGNPTYKNTHTQHSTSPSLSFIQCVVQFNFYHTCTYLISLIGLEAC
jgi:hypothetical protein